MPYKDPEKQKEYLRQHFLNNKEKYKESTSKSRATYNRNRTKWLQDIKESVGCQKCGEKRGPVLCFHHVDPSTKECKRDQSFYKLGKKKVVEEMKKCIVLCMNCHTLLHWEEVNGIYILQQ